MLALLVGLALPKGSPLPNPYLSKDLRPVLRIGPIEGLKPYQVVRGADWRRPGLVRLSYFYLLRKDDASKVDEVFSDPDFGLVQVMGSPVPGQRVERTRSGIRQIVQLIEVKTGERYRPVGVSGPAQLLRITEIPISDLPPNGWHRIPALENPPLPPGYPPSFKFLRGATVNSVSSDPIIPFAQRKNIDIAVMLLVPREFDEVCREAHMDLYGKSSKIIKHRDQEMIALGDKFGLLLVHIVRPPNNGPNSRSTILYLSYSFEDVVNSPRIE